MPIDFSQIRSEHQYSRDALAKLWGYKSFHAIARGVVTPQSDNKIVLFVTSNKQSSAEQYEDRLHDDVLHWEGPNDHFAEKRMTDAKTSDEEIHLFYRDKHHSDFIYKGQLEIEASQLHLDRPSKFQFRLKSTPNHP